MTAEDNVELHTPLQEIEFESYIDQYFRISTTRQKKTMSFTHDTTHLYSRTTHYVTERGSSSFVETFCSDELACQVYRCRYFLVRHMSDSIV